MQVWLTRSTSISSRSSLAGGVRLFDHLTIEPTDLEIIRIVPAPGVAHLRYRVAR